MFGIGERGLPGRIFADRDGSRPIGYREQHANAPRLGRIRGAKQKRLAEQKRFEGSVTKNWNREPQRRLMTDTATARGGLRK